MRWSKNRRFVDKSFWRIHELLTQKGWFHPQSKESIKGQLWIALHLLPLVHEVTLLWQLHQWLHLKASLPNSRHTHLVISKLLRKGVYFFNNFFKLLWIWNVKFNSWVTEFEPSFLTRIQTSTAFSDHFNIGDILHQNTYFKASSRCESLTLKSNFGSSREAPLMPSGGSNGSTWTYKTSSMDTSSNWSVLSLLGRTQCTMNSPPSWMRW